MDRARSSAGEHYLDMVGVTGSIPVAPTTPSEQTVNFPGALKFSRNPGLFRQLLAGGSVSGSGKRRNEGISGRQSPLQKIPFLTQSLAARKIRNLSPPAVRKQHSWRLVRGATVHFPDARGHVGRYHAGLAEAESQSIELLLPFGWWIAKAFDTDAAG